MKKLLHLNLPKNLQKETGWILAILLLITTATTSCKKDLTDNSNEQLITAAAKKGKSPDIIVHSGQSIQAAVNAASAGFIIQIEAGTYKESIVINKPGIQLIGSENQEVIINNQDGEKPAKFALECKF